jgi:hypothetical protein
MPRTGISKRANEHAGHSCQTGSIPGQQEGIFETAPFRPGRQLKEELARLENLQRAWG